MNLQVIEQNNQRVLTTMQLAEKYGTDEKLIQQNFSNNKKRYREGKHFFLLQGDDLRSFKRDFENLGVAQNINRLYLWTEKGAWLHAKSLNTDQAWNAYEMLVDDYYRVKERELDVSMLSPELRALIKMEKRQLEQDKRIEVVEQNQDNIKELLSLNPTEWRKKVNKIINAIARVRGGYESYKDIRNETYEMLEERGKCRLSIRLTNKKSEMALNGAPKSKIDKVNKMDVIADDARLTEIYLAIVKEFAIKYGVKLD